jgi:putative flippase GtrA
VTLNITLFVKYLLASSIALMVDYGCYWILCYYRVFAFPLNSAIGYGAGLVVAYFLVANKIFNNGWLKEYKKYEALLFILSGALGLVITYSVVFLCNQIFGENIHYSKMASIIASFFSVYFFRKHIVFRSRLI